MLIETTQIVFGPGRFLPVGSRVEMPDVEAHQLVNENKAIYVETTALSAGPENAMKPITARPRPQRK